MGVISNRILISNLYTKKEKSILLLSALLQVVASILDLFGVVLIGLIGSVATLGISAQQPGGLTARLLEIMQIENLSLQGQVAAIGALAALVLIGKTLFSILIMRRTIFYLANRSAMILSRVINKSLSMSYQNFKKYSRADLIHSFTNGINTISMGIVAQGLTLVSDISLLLILGIGLFIAEPILAGITLIFFSSIGFMLYLLLNVRARRLGEESTEIYRNTARRIEDLVGAYRELTVKNLKGNIASEIKGKSLRNSQIIGEFSFMPYISKYTIEIGMILGVLGISAVQFSRDSVSGAVATISVFLVASFRIGPAILRIQSITVGIKRALGQSKPTLHLLHELQTVETKIPEITKFNSNHSGFKSNIEIKELDFSYEEKFIFRGVSLAISQGEHIALIGNSGEGKTTLVDLICGNLKPSKGQVRISGLTPEEAMLKWPGALAYVPQNVYVTAGSIRSNLTLGYEGFGREISEEILLECMKQAELYEFVREKGGLDFELLEDGRNISGGQVQRLGLARALVSNPQLVILDEATSALDANTQREIGITLSKLRGKCTIIMIAHRASSIRHCDRIFEVSMNSIHDVTELERRKIGVNLE